MKYEWPTTFYVDAQLQEHMDAIEAAFARYDRDEALTQLDQAIDLARAHNVSLARWMSEATPLTLQHACVSAILTNGQRYH